MRIIEPIKIAPELMAAQPFAVLPASETFMVQPGQMFTVSGFTSNVPEDDYPLWDESTAYVEGDWVMWEHRVYEALGDSTGKEPGVSPADWNDGGYTNRYRMFDEKISTPTTNPESIEVGLAPGKPIDSVAFFNVDAGDVRVKSIDPYQGTVFDRSVAPVSTEGIDNWHSYFFNPIELMRDFVITGVPSSSFGSLEITLTKQNGTASVGSVVIGSTFVIGCATYGTEVGITDYSYKAQDDYGNWEIVERGYSKRAEFDVVVKTRETGQIQRKLAKYRAKPLVWIGSEQLEATVIYGYYKDFSIVLSGPNVSDCTITVEGLN